MRRTYAIALLLLVGAAAVAAWTLWPRRPANVVLITIDTMRPDRISAYGYTKHETPNLDRLAREGTLFENAFCDVTWTTPSMASVMTGMYATRHGLRSSFQTLKPEARTLAEILHDHGLQTAAIIASYPLHSVFGLNQGFDLYDEEFTNPIKLKDDRAFGPVPPAAAPAAPPSDDTEALRWFLLDKAANDAYRPDSAVTDRVLSWLRNERRGRFFLWIHYFGPHEKPTGLTGPTAYLEEIPLQIAAYDPDVRIVDAEIGRFLSALDELDLTTDTAVIVHADHGQSLLEHDYFGHGRNIYDPTQRIPLIIRAPGTLPPGQRERFLARNIDLFPTILALLGIENPSAIDGASLLAGSGPKEERSTYVETYLSATSLFAERIGPLGSERLGMRRLGIRTAAWKYIVNDPVQLLDRTDAQPPSEELRRRYYSEELYDLTKDPGETANLIFEHRDIGQNFREQILRLHSVQPIGSQAMPLDETTRDRLEALGYLAE